MRDEQDRIDELFLEAMALDAAAQEAFVADVCRSDPMVGERVREMIAANARIPTQFLVGAKGGGPHASRSLPEWIGPYRVNREIGRGGMGVVYEAEQQHPRRRVAVKLVPPALASDQLLRRFRLEAELLGRLEDPGIARIYDAGSAEVGGVSTPYIVMEYIEGLPLDEYAESNALTHHQVIELIARVCDAVQYAHQRGVIHRDLKPGNVLVTARHSAPDEPVDATAPADELGNPKILDFGIARLLDGGPRSVTVHTGQGMSVGTPEYMSPEQLEGDSGSLDTRCDVYALGLVLYRLLAKRPAFATAGSSFAELTSAARKGPRALGRIDTSLRGDLEIIVGKALAHDRGQRYDSAGQLADDIRRHLRNEPILAHPPSAVYVFRKFARRNKALVGGVAATVLALVSGLIASGVLLVRAENARAEAELARERMEEVAEFQATLLEGIEVPEMGERLVAGLESALGAPASGTFSRIDGTNLARDVLEHFIVARALAELDAGYTDDPVVEAELRASVARIYEGLYLYERSIEQWRRVVALRVEHFGPGHELSIESTYNLGIGLSLGLEWDEAVVILRDVADRYERRLGVEHRTTLAAKSQLAAVLSPLGRKEEADALLGSVVEAMRRVLPPTDADLLTAEGMLAALYGWTRTEDVAIAQFERALRESILAYGEHGQSVLTIRQNLGAFLFRRHRYEDAEEHFRLAQEGWRYIAGDNHEATVVTGYQLGDTLLALDRFEDAEAVLGASREIAESLYAPDHVHAVVPTKLHAECLCELGRYEEGLLLARRALSGARASQGPDSSTVGSVSYWLARNHYGLGNDEEAEDAFREAVRILAPHVKWESEYSGAVTHLAELLLRRADFETAEGVLLPAAATLLPRRAETHDPAAEVIRMLLDLYSAWHDADPSGGHDRSEAYWRGQRS